METTMKKFAIVLAEREDFGRITMCDCGAVHLQAGPLDVTFSADAYLKFVDLVRASAPSFQGAKEPAHDRPTSERNGRNPKLLQ